MWTQILITLLGAALSSLLTLGLAFLIFDRRYKRRLSQELDEQIDQTEKRLREAIGEEAEKAGELIAGKVRKGVRQGVLDAVASIPSSDVINETTQNVVKTGVDLVEASLSTFLGGKPRKR